MKKTAMGAKSINKLREAEIQAAGTTERLGHDDIMEAARARLKELEEQKRA